MARPRSLRSFVVVWALLVLSIGVVRVHAAITCAERNLGPSFVGGGWVDEHTIVTVHDERDDAGGVRTRFRYHNANGVLQNDLANEQGAVHATTCPKLGLIAVAKIARAFDGGINIVQPFIYYANGTQYGNVFRTTKDTAWQMYFSPDCSKLLVRSDDKYSQTWDLSKLRSGSVNNFNSQRDGRWMQMAHSQLAYTGSGRVMRKLILQGRAGQNKKAKLALQFRVTGNINRFAIAQGNKWMFATGIKKDMGAAFKNIVRLQPGKPKAQMIDFNPDDLNGISAAYHPNELQFAGVFEQASGNIVKLYASWGKLDAVLQESFLAGKPADQIYFRPNTGDKLLVLGTAASRKFWVCGPIELPSDLPTPKKKK